MITNLFSGFRARLGEHFPPGIRQAIRRSGHVRPQDATASNLLFIGERDSPIPDFWDQCLMSEGRTPIYYVGLQPRRLPPFHPGDPVIHLDQPASSTGHPTQAYNPLRTIRYWTSLDLDGLAGLLYPEKTGYFGGRPASEHADLLKSSVAFILKGLDRLNPFQLTPTRSHTISGPDLFCSLPHYLEVIQYPINHIVNKLSAPSSDPWGQRISQRMLQSADELGPLLRADMNQLRTPWVYWVTCPETDTDGPFPSRVVSQSNTPATSVLLSLYAFSALDYLGRQNRDRIYLDGLDAFPLVYPDAAQAAHKGLVRGRAGRFRSDSYSLRRLLERNRFPSLVVGKMTDAHAAMTLTDVPMLRGRVSYEELLNLDASRAFGWMDGAFPHPGNRACFHRSPVPASALNRRPHEEASQPVVSPSKLPAQPCRTTQEVLDHATRIQHQVRRFFS